MGGRGRIAFGALPVLVALALTTAVVVVAATTARNSDELLQLNRMNTGSRSARLHQFRKRLSSARRSADRLVMYTIPEESAVPATRNAVQWVTPSYYRLAEKTDASVRSDCNTRDTCAKCLSDTLCEYAVTGCQDRQPPQNNIPWKLAQCPLPETTCKNCLFERSDKVVSFFRKSTNQCFDKNSVEGAAKKGGFYIVKEDVLHHSRCDPPKIELKWDKKITLPPVTGNEEVLKIRKLHKEVETNQININNDATKYVVENIINNVKCINDDNTWMIVKITDAYLDENKEYHAFKYFTPFHLNSIDEKTLGAPELFCQSMIKQLEELNELNKNDRQVWESKKEKLISEMNKYELEYQSKIKNWELEAKKAKVEEHEKLLKEREKFEIEYLQFNAKYETDKRDIGNQQTLFKLRPIPKKCAEDFSVESILKLQDKSGKYYKIKKCIFDQIEGVTFKVQTTIGENKTTQQIVITCKVKPPNTAVTAKLIHTRVSTVWKQHINVISITPTTSITTRGHLKKALSLSSIAKEPISVWTTGTPVPRFIGQIVQFETSHFLLNSPPLDWIKSTEQKKDEMYLEWQKNKKSAGATTLIMDLRKGHKKSTGTKSLIESDELFYDIGELDLGFTQFVSLFEPVENDWVVSKRLVDAIKQAQKLNEILEITIVSRYASLSHVIDVVNNKEDVHQIHSTYALQWKEYENAMIKYNENLKKYQIQAFENEAVEFKNKERSEKNELPHKDLVQPIEPSPPLHPIDDFNSYYTLPIIPIDENSFYIGVLVLDKKDPESKKKVVKEGSPIFKFSLLTQSKSFKDKYHWQFDLLSVFNPKDDNQKTSNNEEMKLRRDEWLSRSPFEPEFCPFLVDKNYNPKSTLTLELSYPDAEDMIVLLDHKPNGIVLRNGGVPSLHELNFHKWQLNSNKFNCKESCTNLLVVTPPVFDQYYMLISHGVLHPEITADVIQELSVTVLSTVEQFRKLLEVTGDGTKHLIYPQSLISQLQLEEKETSIWNIPTNWEESIEIAKSSKSHSLAYRWLLLCIVDAQRFIYESLFVESQTVLFMEESHLKWQKDQNKEDCPFTLKVMPLIKLFDTKNSGSNGKRPVLDFLINDEERIQEAVEFALKLQQEKTEKLNQKQDEKELKKKKEKPTDVSGEKRLKQDHGLAGFFHKSVWNTFKLAKDSEYVKHAIKLIGDESSCLLWDQVIYQLEFVFNEKTKFGTSRFDPEYHSRRSGVMSLIWHVLLDSMWNPCNIQDTKLENGLHTFRSGELNGLFEIAFPTVILTAFDYTSLWRMVHFKASMGKYNVFNSKSSELTVNNFFALVSTLHKFASNSDQQLTEAVKIITGTSIEDKPKGDWNIRWTDTIIKNMKPK